MNRDRITRRKWTTNSIAGIAAVTTGTANADKSASRLDIIDCHTHFYDPNRTEGVPWPPKGSPLYRTVLPSHLRGQQHYRKVSGTVVVEASSWLTDNDWLLDLAKVDPFIVGIVGNIQPGSPDFEKHVRRFGSNPLFRGIRISVKRLIQLLEKNSLSDLKQLADHDLSLDVNGGPETPAAVARLAPRLPSLRIIQNHIGNVRVTEAEPPENWVSGIRAAARHTNVYCKISALVEGAAFAGRKAPIDLEFYRPYIDVVWNAFEENRVIYGSNWPVSDRAADYHTLQRLVMEYAAEKGVAATSKFCASNAKQAYKWVERPGRR